MSIYSSGKMPQKRKNADMSINILKTGYMNTLIKHNFNVKIISKIQKKK